FIFFFVCIVVLLFFLSFPTRRSSDLIYRFFYWYYWCYWLALMLLSSLSPVRWCSWCLGIVLYIRWCCYWYCLNNLSSSGVCLRRMVVSLVCSTVIVWDGMQRSS